MSSTAVKAVRLQSFKGSFDGSEYELPVHEMNGHKYVLEAVDISKLEIDKEAQPRTRDDNQVRKLAASIKKKVLMQPLLVRYDKARDRYLITEGQHRYFACLQLGISRVPCIIYLDMDKALALLCGIEANAEDRAKALSGGDMASKAHSIMEETRKGLQDKWPKDQITEHRVLQAIGHGTRSQMQKFLVSYKVKELLDSPDSLLKNFVADRQDQNTPITTKNLIFFLTRLMRTQPADYKDEHLRKDETQNLLKLTNLMSNVVLIGKWNPGATIPKEQKMHLHAKNICRRHPFEALGELCAEILQGAGGAHTSSGAAFAKTSQIDWKEVDRRVTSLLNSHVWDETEVSLERAVNEILRRVTAIVKF